MCFRIHSQSQYSENCVSLGHFVDSRAFVWVEESDRVPASPACLALPWAEQFDAPRICCWHCGILAGSSASPADTQLYHGPGLMPHHSLSVTDWLFSHRLLPSSHVVSDRDLLHWQQWACYVKNCLIGEGPVGRNNFMPSSLSNMRKVNHLWQNLRLSLPRHAEIFAGMRVWNCCEVLSSFALGQNLTSLRTRTQFPGPTHWGSSAILPLLRYGPEKQRWLKYIFGQQYFPLIITGKWKEKKTNIQNSHFPTPIFKVGLLREKQASTPLYNIRNYISWCLTCYLRVPLKHNNPIRELITAKIRQHPKLRAD